MEQQSEETPEITGAEEQQSEEEIIEQDSSETEVEDTASEETIKEPESKPNRAQERIRETIARAKKAEQEAAYWRNLAQQPQENGVSEDGIDPVRYAEQVKRDTLVATNQSVSVQIEALRAEQDFPELKTSKVLQSMAKGYIADGYKPYEAAQLAYEDYLEEVNNKKEDAKKRSLADKNLRSATYSPQGKKVSPSDGFTPEEIDNMSTSEYEKNKSRILKQYGIR